MRGCISGQEVSVYHINQDKKVIVYHRWDKGGPGDSVVVAANFSVQPQTDYLNGFPEEGEWIVRFNSDSKLYDREFGDVGVQTARAIAPGQDGLPAKATLDIAPYSVIILSQEKKMH